MSMPALPALPPLPRSPSPPVPSQQQTHAVAIAGKDQVQTQLQQHQVQQRDATIPSVSASYVIPSSYTAIPAPYSHLHLPLSPLAYSQALYASHQVSPPRAIIIDPSLTIMHQQRDAFQSASSLSSSNSPFKQSTTAYTQTTVETEPVRQAAPRSTSATSTIAQPHSSVPAKSASPSPRTEPGETTNNSSSALRPQSSTAAISSTAASSVLPAHIAPEQQPAAMQIHVTPATPTSSSNSNGGSRSKTNTPRRTQQKPLRQDQLSQHESMIHSHHPPASSYSTPQHPSTQSINSLHTTFSPSSLNDLPSYERALAEFLQIRFGAHYHLREDHLVVRSAAELAEMKQAFTTCHATLSGCWLYPPPLSPAEIEMEERNATTLHHRVLRWKYGMARDFLFSFSQMGGDGDPLSMNTSKRGDTRSIVARHLPLRCQIMRDPSMKYINVAKLQPRQNNDLNISASSSVCNEDDSSASDFQSPSKPALSALSAPLMPLMEVPLRCARPSHVCYSTTRILRTDRLLVEAIQADDEFAAAAQKFFAEIDRIAQKYPAAALLEKKKVFRNQLAQKMMHATPQVQPLISPSDGEQHQQQAVDGGQHLQFK